MYMAGKKIVGRQNTALNVSYYFIRISFPKEYSTSMTLLRSVLRTQIYLTRLHWVQCLIHNLALARCNFGKQFQNDNWYRSDVCPSSELRSLDDYIWISLHLIHLVKNWFHVIFLPHGKNFFFLAFFLLAWRVSVCIKNCGSPLKK